MLPLAQSGLYATRYVWAERRRIFRRWLLGVESLVDQAGDLPQITYHRPGPPVAG